MKKNILGNYRLTYERAEKISFLPNLWLLSQLFHRQFYEVSPYQEVHILEGPGKGHSTLKGNERRRRKMDVAGFKPRAS